MYKYLMIVLSLIFSQLYSQSRTLRIAGATTIQPIIEYAAPMFEDSYGITVVVEGGGSGLGIREVESGRINIGMVSRSLTDAEKNRVNYRTIGNDALAIVVNNRNPIQNINKNQLIDIYVGKIRNWSELDIDFDYEIILVSKETGRATLDLFENYTGLNHPDRSNSGTSGYISKDNYEIGSNLEGLTLVGGIPFAIGYVSFGSTLDLMAQGMPIKYLSLDQVEPNRQNITNNRYPVNRELNLVYMGYEQTVNLFLEFIMSDEIQTYLEQLGFIPSN